jgi:hypothetical protein
MHRIPPRKKRPTLPTLHSNNKAVKSLSGQQASTLRPHGKTIQNSKLKGKATKRRPKQVTASSTYSLESFAGNLQSFVE